MGCVAVGEFEGDGDTFLGVAGLMPMTPSPAAMKVPRSMVAVALSGMRTVACESLSGMSSDQRMAVPVTGYSPREQAVLPEVPHGRLLSITRQRWMAGGRRCTHSGCGTADR